MKHFAVLLLAVASCFAVDFEGYARMSAAKDSINYGEGVRNWGMGGFRISGDSWNIHLDADKVMNGEGAVVPRYYRNHLEAQLEGRFTFGGFTVNPEIQLDKDIDSAMVVLPLSLGEGYRNSALRPGLSLSYSLPGVFEVSGTGRYWKRDITALDSDVEDTEWTDLSYGADAVWHTPVGGYLAVGGVSHQTRLDGFDYDRSWSRVDISAGYEPLKFPSMTFLTAEAEYSLYTGEDYTGATLPDRFTARLRAVQNVARNVMFNVTFSQAADFYEDETRFGPFQSAIRSQYKFSGWGSSPSSIMIGGQLTESAITTRLGELEGRISLVSGLSALITGKLWYGPSSVAGTGGYRTREIIGGGLEFRMNNGLNTFVIYEREASNLAPNDVWGKLRGGVGFYPAQF